MNVHDIYGSKYLTAHDLGGKSFTLTIKAVTLEEMRTHDQKVVKKMVLWFAGANKGLVANRTNAMIVAGLYGPETDSWLQRRITIYPTQVRAFGSMQDCIRVREEVPSVPKPVAQAPTVEDTSGLDDPEDVTDYNGDEIFDAE